MLNPAARKSLETILQHAKEDKLGAQNMDGCIYHSDDGHFCAVGCLLTPEEHKELDRLEKNFVGVQTLVRLFPTLLERTGFSENELRFIQYRHDSAYGHGKDNRAAFILTLETCLNANMLDTNAF